MASARSTMIMNDNEFAWHCTRSSASCMVRNEKRKNKRPANRRGKGGAAEACKQMVDLCKTQADTVA